MKQEKTRLHGEGDRGKIEWKLREQVRRGDVEITSRVPLSV